MSTDFKEYEESSYLIKKIYITEILDSIMLNDIAKLSYIYSEDIKFAFQAADGTTFYLPVSWTRMSGLVQEKIKEEIFILRSNVDTEVIRLLWDYFVQHKGVEGPAPSTPLRSKDLRKCGVEEWDVAFLINLFQNSCCKHLLYKIMMVASRLKMDTLMHLGGAQISACLKGMPIEQCRSILEPCPQHQDKIYHTWDFF